jgi:squalene-hopene/tetraprenyl-beta-curcumene cyclase
LPEAAAAATRKKIIDQAMQKQSADGGWGIEALGPWAEHDAAAPSSGSNSYATALTVFALKQGGVARSNAKLARGVDWLKAHQNAESGYWAAESMNKRYPADSMPAHFMRDAATAFAVLALIE